MCYSLVLLCLISSIKDHQTVFVFYLCTTDSNPEHVWSSVQWWGMSSEVSLTVWTLACADCLELPRSLWVDPTTAAGWLLHLGRWWDGHDWQDGSESDPSRCSDVCSGDEAAAHRGRHQWRICLFSKWKLFQLFNINLLSEGEEEPATFQNSTWSWWTELPPQGWNYRPRFCRNQGSYLD